MYEYQKFELESVFKNKIILRYDHEKLFALNISKIKKFEYDKDLNEYNIYVDVDLDGDNLTFDFMFLDI